MKGAFSLAAAALLVGSLIATDAQAADSTATDHLLTACRQVTSEFQKTLKGELLDAVKAGGPAHAIKVCQKIAPAVSKDYSTLPGWSVRRTTINWRNPHNRPDSFEVAVLKALESDERAEFSEWISDSTGQHFRYLSAIRMQGICIPCHGAPARLADTVRTAIANLYPDDHAVNFRPGDLRGAFSVVVNWPEGKTVVDSLVGMMPSHDKTE